jgi:glycosyltransferase involved in cell wall biosynthesis
MNIGYDAKRAVYNFSGLGNYSRTLIQALSTYHPNHNYVLYAPGYRPSPRLDSLQNRRNVSIRTPRSLAGRLLKPLWRSRLMVRDLQMDEIDLFHGLSNELPHGLPRSGVKSVVTIHDLIFLRYPEFYPWLDRRIYTTKVRYACRAADLIVTVSEQTKQDVIDLLSIDPGRVVVAYQSCDPSFETAATEEQKQSVRQRHNLSGEYLLYVGNIEKRKNLLAAIKALELQSDSGLTLAVIGSGGAYLQEVSDYVQSHRLKDRVRFLYSVPFADFPAVYQMASAFVYPSVFEGFGIPIIEALWSKTPVITSSGSCFAEAGGPASLYVTPGDHSQLAAAIERVLRDSSLRSTMIAEGLAHVQKFRNEATAKRMMTIYEATLGGAYPGPANW